MKKMFKNCKNIQSLDLSNFETDTIRNTQEMFFNCSSLTSLDLSKLITTSVTNMTQMFYDTSNLQDLDIRNFDTHNCIDFDKMFDVCYENMTLTINKKNCQNIMSIIPDTVIINDINLYE